MLASLGAIWPVEALAAGGLATLVVFTLFCVWTLVLSITLLRRA